VENSSKEGFMSKKEERRPSIRFKGYTEPWEQRKLGEVLSERNIQEVPTEQIPLVSFTVEQGVTPKTERYNREFLVREETKKYKYTKYNDIVYNPANLKFGAIARNKYGEAFFSPIYVTFEANYSNVLPEFIEKILTSNDFIQKALKFQEGTVYERMAVKADDFLKLVIKLPTLPEQTAIGSFFQELDQLITLQQRELDLMKEGKKTLLSKMFPKDGEKFPEIRFPGFTNAWEQRKLGEVSNRVKGNDGRMDLPTLTISAGQGWLDQKERFSGNIAGKEQKNYTLLTRGELSYNHGNSKLAKYGAVFQLNDFEEALVPKVYHSFKMVDGNSGLFIEYLFSTKLPDKELRKLISSGARMDGLLNITYNDFVTINLTIPRNKEEQIAIGSFFQELDQLITLQQREMEILKTMKSALLKAMFA